jgi:chromosome segregation ATPase
LKLQQENKDRKKELFVNNLEGNVKDLENLLEEKNSKIKAVKAHLAEAHLQNENQVIQISDYDKQLKRLSTELEKVNSTFKDDVDRYEHETKELKEKVKAKVEKSSKLSEAFKVLRDTFFSFTTQCSLRLHGIFNSVGAVSEDANYSVDNIPKALEFVEKEINDFDEVMVSCGDFCALGAARGTAMIFVKAGCNHLKMLTSLPSISPCLNLRIFQVKLEMSVIDLLPKFGRRVAES